MHPNPTPEGATLRSRLNTMIPPLDVFSIRDQDHETRWLGTAKNLAQTFDMVRRNGAGSYFVFSQRTGHKNFYDLDPNGTIRLRYLPSAASSNQVT